MTLVRHNGAACHRGATAITLLALAACGHSAPFTSSVQRETTPFEAILPSRLTYNAGNNYSPSWTEDGRGILYHYSFPSPDLFADDRCVGLLPPGGGARTWELCNTRREHKDSADSFSGVALAADGRLLYLELSSRRGSGGLSGVNQPPQSRNLWLADTTYPFQRRRLVNLSSGLMLNGVFFHNLSDVRWLGSDAFLALARAPRPGPSFDSVGVGVGIVRGDITATGATLSMIPGTDGARNFALAENGTSLIFTGDDLRLQRTPIAGGTPTTAATLPTLPVNDPSQPTGSIGALSCSGTTCIANAGTFWRVNLATGQATQIVDRIQNGRLSPVSGDVVGTLVTSTVRIQVGGQLQPLTSIILYRSVVP